jgi:cation-transporting ATPase 13A1
MYWGIVVVTAVAFSCATEFIPEINTQLKLVPFTDDFKITMTSVMILDYMGCWIIEKALKLLFSDYKPKDIAVRRPDQLEKEQKRLKAEQEAADREKEIAAGKA